MDVQTRAVVPPADRGAPGARLLTWIRANLPRLYLTRFPLILAAFLTLLPPFGLWAVPAMFRSMFILTPNGITAVSLFATLTAFTAMAMRRVILLYGPERFATFWRVPAAHLPARSVATNLFLALPMIATVVVLSSREGRMSWFTASSRAIAGVISAAILMWLASVIQALTVRAETDLPDLVVPTNRVVTAAHEARFTLPSENWFRRVLHRLKPILGPGYLASNGDLLPGHGFAVAFMAVYIVVYAWGYFLWQPGTAAGAGVPALVFILIIATLWIWFLSGAGFFFDRHRVPLVIPVVLVSFLIWSVSRSDFYFPLMPPGSGWAQLDGPGAIARARRHPLLAVVAVDGGGIQASAWAARVLTGIQAQWPEFRHSIRLISSISGGSVGTMYYVSTLQQTKPPDATDLQAALDLAKRGSLNETAWGLAYPDLWRVLVPIPPRWRFVRDRAWGMQQAWEREWGDRMPHLRSADGSFSVPRLSEWVPGVREGWRPAVSFGAVEVESGERFAFATFAPPFQWAIGTPERRYRGRDLTVTTAARLSATFPYVTPIARAYPEPTAAGEPPIFEGHFADGGYYDNTGMGLAMRWLDRALAEDVPSYQNKVVAFIRIRSARDGAGAPIKDRGWLYQVIGPLQTMLAVRTAGQRERASTELDFLQRLWCQQGVEIRAFEFAFDREEPPLSWQLSPVQADDIDTEWRDPSPAKRSERNEATLARLLETANAPDVGRCVAPAVARPQ